MSTRVHKGERVGTCAPVLLGSTSAPGPKGDAEPMCFPLESDSSSRRGRVWWLLGSERGRVLCSGRTPRLLPRGQCFLAWVTHRQRLQHAVVTWGPVTKLSLLDSEGHSAAPPRAAEDLCPHSRGSPPAWTARAHCPGGPKGSRRCGTPSPPSAHLCREDLAQLRRKCGPPGHPPS